VRAIGAMIIMVIALAVALFPSEAFAEANFDSVLVHQPQAKWIDQHGTLSWKVQVINGTNDTAYFNLFVRILDTAGFELTYTGKLMEKQPPQSIGEYKGTFVVIQKYLSQFGSVEFAVEKDEYSTRMAEEAKSGEATSE
jgi:hypothetical protein